MRDRGRAGELFDFAVERLPSMRLEDGAFCFEVAAPELAPRGRSLRYTLIVLLGLLRAERAGVPPPVDAGAVKSVVFDELDADELGPGDLGLVLWADSRSGLQAPDEVLKRLDGAVGRNGGMTAIEGLELSWIAIGCAHAVAAGCTERSGERLASEARSEQLRRAETPSGLFVHRGKGRRSRFPNFATQIYGVLALAELSRLREDTEARSVAASVADRLLELQRPDGGWPWLFDVRSGVVEPYEIYSVHQDAMAPMALNALSETTGEARYRDAALRGLEWIWGRNELEAEMLDREERIVYRSIRRRRPFDRLALYANTATAALRRPLLGGLRRPVELNRTDRPYHLGWLLEAWAGETA